MDLKEILRLFDERSHLGSMVYEENGQRVELNRTQQLAPIPTPSVQVPQATSQTVPLDEDHHTYTKVCSPMVGTLYTSSAPDADPYVKVGSFVKEGDVLCLIEAMKMFNKIKAEKSGYVREILVENESPVEYNQPLIMIEES